MSQARILIGTPVVLRAMKRSIFPLLLVIVAACGRDPVSPLQDGAVIIVKDVRTGWNDAVTIVDATIVSDSLRMTARFGGGCAQHSLALLVGDGIDKSVPPQVQVRLAHRANGDPCDALLTRMVSFDLAAVRSHFRPPGGSEPVTIAFVIDGVTEPILYTF